MQVTKIRKRKRFTVKKKRDILNELSSSGISVASLARRHGIHPVTIHCWKQIMSKKSESRDSEELISNDQDYKDVLSENDSLKDELDNLKKAFADIAIDNQILKTYNEVLKKNQRKEKLKK